MLDEIYKELKQNYSKYIILIKNGNFYLAFNKDAIIINNILNYSIKEIKNGIKIGFPINILEKVIQKIEDNKINYLIVENKEIINKKNFNTNRYDQYHNDYYIHLKKINNISNILKENLKNQNISLILEEIEGILCKIDF